MKDRPEFYEDDEGPFVRLYPTGTLGVDYRLPVPPADGPLMLPAAPGRHPHPPRAYADPSRITAALDLNGLYGPLVDVACGVREPAVDEWETGERAPTEEQVRRLATLTGYLPGWFYDPEPWPSSIWPTFLCGPHGCVVTGPAEIPPPTLGVVCPTCGHVAPVGTTTP